MDDRWALLQAELDMVSDQMTPDEIRHVQELTAKGDILIGDIKALFGVAADLSSVVVELRRMLAAATALPCEVCGQPAERVCSCILGQPVSLAYCGRCLVAGNEAWWVVVATVSAVTDGIVAGPERWRSLLAKWAVEIVDRSMAFHGKSESDLIREVAANA